MKKALFKEHAQCQSLFHNYENIKTQYENIKTQIGDK
jgi:hypothetical protein